MPSLVQNRRSHDDLRVGDGITLSLKYPPDKLEASKF
jgi:hypothetical protein